MSSKTSNPVDFQPTTIAVDRTATNVDVAELHVELQRVSTSAGSTQEVREQFRQIVLTHTNAVGVGHVIRDEDGNWDLRPHHVTGRVPRRNDFVEKFARCCDTTISRNSIQLEHFLGLESIYVPIRVGCADSEVMLVLTEETNATRAIFVLEIVSAYFGLWLKGSLSARSDWKLTSLAALVEVVTGIEQSPSRREACQLAVNELSRHLGASPVAVAMRRNGKLVLEALSGTQQLDRNSTTATATLTLLSETLAKDEVCVWPPIKADRKHLMLGHDQFLREFQVGGVISSPLCTPGGSVMGAFVAAADKEMVHGDRLGNFVRAAAPRVASALEVAGRAERSWIARSLRNASRSLKEAKGRTAVLAAALVLAVLMMPVTYRIRCDSIAEPTERRFAVAPFQGLVERGFVQPGDLVEAGQVLARMDAQPIRLELASAVAERGRSIKKREIALAERNVPGALLAGLETDELSAKIELLERQQGQFEIRSPIQGVVLSGSLERSEGASVELGETLFEVGPLAPLKINLAVPSDEVRHVQPGQTVKVWVDGLGASALHATVDRVRPRSEIRDGSNVFIVECLISNQQQRLRPGMKGHARIDTASHPLAWNLFHKPWQFLASRLTWW